MKELGKLSRRTFAKTSATTLAFGLAALQTETSQARIIGANDTVRCALAGCGTRGKELLDVFKKTEKVEIVGLSDADSAILDATANTFAPQAAKEKDFRKLIERDDVDALIIATPDHWHAFQTIEACKAEKDVYVEKPLSNTVVEGRKMVSAAKRYQRVVQVGFQRRSAPFHLKMMEMKKFNQIGPVSVTRCGRCNNMYSNGIGRLSRKDAPATLDWDLWLGPRYQPYQDNITPYKFRWWGDYSSPVTSFGCEYFDTFRTFFADPMPTSVCSMGGKMALSDDRTTPDNAEIVFLFPTRRMLIFSLFETTGNPLMPTDDKFKPLGDMEFRGTSGTMYLSDKKYIIKPEVPGLFQGSTNPRMGEDTFELDEASGANLDPTTLHIKNFLDCIRSREEPACPIEEGHFSTVMGLIAYASQLIEMRLDWDGRREQFTNHAPANLLLHYEYRSPWKLD